MSFIRIKTIQTRDCYYPIYLANGLKNHANGYYFYDDELEDIYNREGDYGMGYFGPYNTIDEACIAQNRHYKSIMSL